MHKLTPPKKMMLLYLGILSALSQISHVSWPGACTNNMFFSLDLHHLLSLTTTHHNNAPVYFSVFLRMSLGDGTVHTVLTFGVN